MTNKTHSFSSSRNRELETQEKDILYITHNEKAFAHKEPETVLETLERNNIDVDFNCRQGFCGVCRTKLLSGQVEYKLDPPNFLCN